MKSINLKSFIIASLFVIATEFFLIKHLLKTNFFHESSLAIIQRKLYLPVIIVGAPVYLICNAFFTKNKQSKNKTNNS
ncbi:hypothetical protein AAHN93_04240 [Vandammella animalimorsus]|uniref:hypothetical protein n=1 Tax=Vandammella animalimorsus TaxID=2029117 RepID=UPI001177A3C2|nr:hypothetical protein [Vandammella animalimorsus]